MPRNGSGTFALPAGNPVTTGTTISSTTHNNTMADVASAITESIARDGQTTPTANLPMGGFKHTNVADATARTDYGKVSQIQDGGYMMLSSVAGTDTITASITPSITAYASGQFFTFIAAGANTGAVTLNINSIGAKSVTKLGTTALVAGDIPSGAVVSVVYDGTQFQIIGLMAATYQPVDALLTALAAQTTAANNVQAYSGADTPTLLSTGTSSGNIPLIGTASATDTLAGLVELATAAEAQAFTDATRAITPSTLASAFGGANRDTTGDGFQILPGGLIIQWGNATTTATGVTVTFPMAFPSAAFVFCTGSNTASARMSTYQALTTTSVFVQAWTDAGGQVASNVSWMAIGI